jgi:hypothetical protein
MLWRGDGASDTFESMPNIAETLAKQTYKEDGVPVEKRVFYTLTGGGELASESLITGRNSKAIALLFKALVDDGTLTGDQLDKILLEVIH